MFVVKKIAALAALFVLAMFPASAKEKYPIPPIWDEVVESSLKQRGFRSIPESSAMKNYYGERLAFTVGGAILSKVGLNNPQVIFPGSELTGASVIVYLGLGLDGNPAILKLSDTRTEVLFSESSLPGGRVLISPQKEVYFAYTRGTLFVAGFDASRPIGSRPAVTLYSKTGDSDELRVLLASEQTRIRAQDPKQGNVEVDFTYLQGVNFFFNGNTITAYGLLNPPQLPGGPTPIPQVLVIRRQPDGSWLGLFNNQASSDKTHFASIVGMCPTDAGTLYVVGRLTDAPNTIPANQYAVTRVVSREPKLLGAYLRLAGNGIDCGPAGVQVYTATLTEGQPSVFGFAYIGDTTTVESASPESPNNRFFSGSSADATLFTLAAAFFAGPQVSYLISSNRELIRITQGKASLVKSPQQLPAGQAFSVTLIDGKPVYLQAEGIAVAYWLFQPSCQNPGGVQPGEILTLRCPEFVVENQRPSLSLTVSGSVLSCPVSAEGSTAVFNCQIPGDAPSGTFNARVTGQGLTFDVPVQIRGAGGIPTPRISAVTNPAGGLGPFAPRSRFIIQLQQGTGRAEICPDVSACFELGNVTATFGGDPVRLFSIDRKGILTGLIPKSALLKSRGDLVVNVRDSGGQVTSAPVTLNLAPVANSFSLLTDPAGNSAVPVMFDETGALVGWSLRPVKKGTSVTVLGTGCGLPVEIGDDQNVPDPGYETLAASVNYGGIGANASSKVEPLYPGLCSYKFTISPDTPSGRTSLYFSSDPDAALTLNVE